MNLILRRFYQSVDLDDPDKVNYFLALETPEGEEILLPVQQETTQALIQKLYAKKQMKEVEDAEEHEDPEVGEDEEGSYEEDPEEAPEGDDDLGEMGQDEDRVLEPVQPVKKMRLTAAQLAEMEGDGVPGNGVFAAAPRHMKKPVTEDEVPSL